MNRIAKGKMLCSFLVGLLLVMGTVGQTALAQENQEIQQQLDKLKNTVDELKEQVPKLGYINRQEAFSVFPQKVKEERQAVINIEKKMNELRTKAEESESGKSDIQRDMDLLRAKHLQAKIKVDWAILNTMVEAKGFYEINEKLSKLKEQAKPIRKEIAGLINDIEDYTVSPKQVSESLNQIDQQYQQLDDILTNVSQLKITQVTRSIAFEKNYDLVLEQQNVLLYRKKKLVTDITPDVKEKLKDDLKPKGSE